MLPSDTVVDSVTPGCQYREPTAGYFSETFHPVSLFPATLQHARLAGSDAALLRGCTLDSCVVIVAHVGGSAARAAGLCSSLVTRSLVRELAVVAQCAPGTIQLH